MISRPCLVTREAVMRSVDLNYTAFKTDAVDRAIESGTESVEDLCQRVFYPTDTTRSFDWPNFQYSYPWRLYLDRYELAAQPTLFISGPYLTIPVVIPVGNYILQPVNEGPPWRWIDLRRDLNSAFGNNTTPQNDIQITGTFGYWTKTKAAGQLAVAMTDMTTGLAQVTNSNLIGVGDVMIVDSERMLVQDKIMIDTGVAWSGLSSNPPSMADNIVGVPSGTAFAPGETISADAERMYISDIQGNNLIVRRGYDGTVLTTHSGGTLWAARQLAVERGALGTTGATHLINAPATTVLIPGIVRDLALAEATSQVAQEPGAYSFGLLSTLSSSASVYGGTARGQQREATPGIGLSDLRTRVMNSRYSRSIRTRVV